MTGGRRFSPPDWGQDHLSLDAIVAYVDDELAAGAHHRAEAHLACCPDCRAEVVAQRQARTALRAAGGPQLPSSLLHTLRAIPVEAELPPPPPGLGITADGQFVLLRDIPDGQGLPDAVGHPPASRRLSRRARFGAVSGLAIGALAVGALAVPGSSAPTGQGAVGAVPGGGSVSDAVAVLSTAAVPVRIPAVVESATDPSVSPSTADRDTATSDASATEGGAVLDPQVRRRLDRAPVAFYRSP
jgi:anti-sigma factor RsiW